MGTQNYEEVRYVSISRAAEIVGVSARQMLNFCKKGLIGKREEGGSRYVITYDEAIKFRSSPRPMPGRPRGILVA